MAIKLVLADDHELILRGLEALFHSENDFEVLASCSCGNKAMEAIHRYQPDVAVLDICMPDMGGLDIVREIRRAKLTSRLVLFTATIRDEEMIEAIQLKVNGIVLKNMASQFLVQCIRTVHGGGQWIERHATTRALDKMMQLEAGARELSTLLTAREIELARMIARGLRNKEIAGRLFISEGTVKVHLNNIFKKLNVGSRTELLRYAQEKGLV